MKLLTHTIVAYSLDSLTDLDVEACEGTPAPSDGEGLTADRSDQQI